MPAHLKALIVILGIASVVFFLAKVPACAMAMTEKDFARRRNLWFAITLAAFLAYNFWVYIVVAAVLLLFALPREPNKFAMFLFLLFAVPTIPAKISGLGIVEHFFAIHYVRLLALAVLLPAFLQLWKRPESEPFGRLLPDKLVAAYLILQFALTVSDNSLTQTLRHGAFYAFIDVFLPYYVASRSLRNPQEFRDALMAFVVAALVLSAIGIFEYAKQWLLYKELEATLGAERWGYGNYTLRGESLRAIGTTGQPIVLGYVVVVAMALYLYLRKLVPSAILWSLGLLLLVGGLIAPVSRGPWVGAAAMLLAFAALGPTPIRGLVKLGLAGALVFAMLMMSPVSEKVIDLLPFVGTVEEHNITYRQRFVEVSIDMVMQNPLFGYRNYVDLVEMDELKPQGLLDTLNVFLTVALGSGLVGLTLFAGFFLSVAVVIFRGMRSELDRNGELYLLGRALLAALAGIVVIINTVSPILFIPVIYWSMAGLGVAYACMLARLRTPADVRSTGLRAGFARMKT